MYKQIVIGALARHGHDIEQVDTPLGNEMIVDGKWLLEMDRDGAFAATVSSIEKDTGSYSNTHKLAVFQNPHGAPYDETATTICSIIEKTMDELNTKTI